MASEAILDSRLYPRVGLQPAPDVNHRFTEERQHMAHLLNQLLIYDRLIIPSKDMGIVPILVSWFGYDFVTELIGTESLSFAHLPSVLGYAGNGIGISGFTIEPGDRGWTCWWQEAVFGSSGRAVELQLENACEFLSTVQRTELFDQVLGRTNDVEIDNDVFMSRIVHDTYVEIQRNPDLREFVLENGAEVTNLAHLDGVDPDQMKISTLGDLADSIDLVLRIAELNTDFYLGEYLGNVDIATSDCTDELLRNRLRRFGMQVPLTHQAINVMDLAEVPNIGQAVANGSLPLNTFWDARQSADCAAFRVWIREHHELTARDLCQHYIAAVERIPAVETLPVRLVRFAAVSVAGLWDPALGLGVGVSDQLLTRFARGYSPRLSMDRLRRLPIHRPGER